MSFFLGQCPYGWTLLIPGENAINPCVFEYLMLSNVVIMMPFGFYQLWSTMQKPAPGKIKYNKIGALGLLRVIATLLQAVLLLSQKDQLYFFANGLIILFVTLPLTFFALFKTPVASGSVIFYWLFQMVVYAIAACQNILTVYKVADDNPVIMYVVLPNAIHLFVSNAFLYTPVHEVVKESLESGLLHANILSKLTFFWMNDLIKKGYNNEQITDEDLPIPPAQLDPGKSYNDLKKVWENQENKSLLFALSKVFGFTVVTAVFYAVLDDILSFAEPQLLRLLIKFFDEDQPLIVGFLIAFGMFFVSVLETALFNRFFISIYEAGLGTKSALMTLIYNKALKLSPEARKERSTGDIINLMSVDVNRIQDLTNQFQMMISAPVKLVLCLVSLYALLGKSTFAGIITMAIAIPLNTLVSRRLKGLHKTQMKYKDERTRTTSEMLSSIKSIKLYAIETAILEKLDYVRNVLELGNLKRIRIFSAFMVFSWNCVPFFVSCSTFTTFALIENRPLSPEIVFPALSLFNLLADPVYEIPSIITALIETSVAFQRITSFLLGEELDEELINYYEKVDAAGNTTVKISNATFLWEKPPQLKKKDYDEESVVSESKVALKIDSFVAKKGELTCIVGRVGAGKSTFLQSILGQLPCVGADNNNKPEVDIHGSIAYCAQVPWILNASVKDNILFGHKYDDKYYHKTIECCQLLPDLDILPDGDETQVGEKGISLSGGQKARLSLARAVYARADIYLLDDILSAVDAHVGKNIISNVINGLLSTKTIILSTNSITVLNHANNILLLADGKIVEAGSFKDVMGSGSKLSTLMTEFGAKFDDDANDEDELPLERTKTTETVRRASIASLKIRPAIKKKQRTAQEEEKSATGKVSFAVYKAYAKACGIPGIIVFLAFLMSAVLFSIIGNYSLKQWSESNRKNGSNKDVFKYVGIYTFFGIGSGFLTLGRTITMGVFCGLRGSVVLHNKMSRAVVRSPMSFFETTPIGRVLNRFSSDINKVDEGLPGVFSFFFTSCAKVFFTLGFIGITMPSFLLVIAVLSVLYIYYQRYYVGTSRDLKRIVNVSRSPIFAHLQESLSGYETIRAYQQQPRFQFLHLTNLESNLKSLYIFRSINRWLSVRLQFIGSIIIFTTASLAITNHLSSGMAGLLISFALQITGSLNWIVRMTVEVETNIVSVERIMEYCELKSEAEEIIEPRPPKVWPSHGSVKFENISAKYRENLDLVLKNVSLDIKPREKVGIVGRTGAGKSSLMSTIFRLIEPTDGKIFIDGLDIGKIGLHDLRSNLAIIPQDSQSFEGTVRQNLDPLELHTDEELWRVLDLSHLKSFIQNLDKDNEDGHVGLEAKLSEGGSNLSVGQRQLLSLARALLNPSKVLILDEATASVDVETDQIVQKTIREAFKDRTILTIAHRIDTVLDSDKIAVLDQGQVKEFDTPDNLLANKESMFYQLCSQGGYIKEDI
ncbi:unnamed protein product [Wickerhamomyces anomalus]